MPKLKKIGRPRKHKPVKGLTRQAVSARAVRDQRRAAGVCIYDGNPKEVKTFANGNTRVLALCRKCNSRRRK